MVVAPLLADSQASALVTNPALLKAVVEQFNRLYIRLRRRWIEQLPSGRYREIKALRKGQRVRGWLRDREVVDHLLGRITIGVFHPGNSWVLAFDLDFHDGDETIRAGLTRSFIRRLEALIGPGCCHVWDTTGKGYRVEIFFERPIRWAHLEHFVGLVLDEPWHREAPEESFTWRSNPYVTVETRPESAAGGRGVKLPLGFDQRNGQLCAFLHPGTLHFVEDQYGYFVGIQPIDPAPLEALVASVPPPAPHRPFQPRPDSPSVAARPSVVFASSFGIGWKDGLLARCERLWEYGLEALGTRHATLLLLAMWHLYQHPSMAEHALHNLLKSWTRRELRERPHLISHDEAYCLADAEQVARDAHRGSYSLACLLEREVILTRAEALLLGQIRAGDLRLAMVAMLLHHKLYANAAGDFRMAHSQLATLLGWGRIVNDQWRPDRSRAGRAVRTLLQRYPQHLERRDVPDQELQDGRHFLRATLYRIHVPEAPEHGPNHSGEDTASADYCWPVALGPGAVTEARLIEAIAALLSPMEPLRLYGRRWAARIARARTASSAPMANATARIDHLKAPPLGPLSPPGPAPLKAVSGGVGGSAMGRVRGGVREIPLADSQELFARVVAGGCSDLAADRALARVRVVEGPRGEWALSVVDAWEGARTLRWVEERGLVAQWRQALEGVPHVAESLWAGGPSCSGEKEGMSSVGPFAGQRWGVLQEQQAEEGGSVTEPRPAELPVKDLSPEAQEAHRLLEDLAAERWSQLLPLVPRVTAVCEEGTWTLIAAPGVSGEVAVAVTERFRRSGLVAAWAGVLAARELLTEALQWGRVAELERQALAVLITMVERRSRPLARRVRRRLRVVLDRKYGWRLLPVPDSMEQAPRVLRLLRRYGLLDSWQRALRVVLGVRAMRPQAGAKQMTIQEGCPGAWSCSPARTISGQRSGL